ncbi:MAG: T9SS type A sorting domain-containing protein [Bacteroidetes bacterium]|nr:T9SS type A sorting domain-containing protein [Bacteroidota bacterium]
MKLKKIIFTLLFILVFQIGYTQDWQQKFEELKSRKSELTFFDIQDAFNEYWKPFNVKNGKYIRNGEEIKAPGWKLFKRWEWYWESRVDLETGEFPETTTEKEWEKYKSSSNFSQLKSSNGSWTSMGPVNSDGGYAGIGRINCISFHPTDTNTYWVGAPSGGLWKTTDDGNSWTALTDNNNVLGVSDIAIPSDYATSNTLYIATGDRDGGSAHTLGGGNSGDNNTIGFLKSTNGGSTWSSAGSFNLSAGYLSGFLRIHPKNNSVLYGGISNAVYKTTDGATTWGTYIYRDSSYVIDMEFHPTNPDTLYIASKGSRPKITRSLDGGVTWTVRQAFESTDRRIELAVSPNAPSMVYAAVTNSGGGLSGIYRSLDNGETFDKIFDGAVSGHSIMGYYSDGSGNNTGQGWYDLALAVSPTDANTLYLGGINTWKSIDGGVSWTINNMWTDHSNYNKAVPKAPEVHADKHVLKFQSPYTLFEGNDGGIYKSTNGGASWTDLTNGMTISQIYRLGVSATSLNTVITGLQDNGSKLFHNGTWYDVKGGDGMECLIDYTNQNIQYATYIDGQIARTTNLWATATDIYKNIGDGTLEGHWVTPFLIDPVDHNTIYVGYQDVWKSTDLGDSFVNISSINTSNNIRSMAIAPSNNKVMYVADQSRLWVTTNGGNTWADVTGNLPTRITYLAVHANDPNTVWATLGGYTGNQVYESTSGGTTWTNISTGLPSLPAFSIVQNKYALTKNQLYVGTDRGVYFKDGTANWTLFNTGLPNVMVTELDIYYNSSSPDSSILFASTYGRGLWKSDLKEIPILSVDASILEIVLPKEKTYCMETKISPTIIVKNNGTNNITSFILSYNINGGAPISYSWTGSLAKGKIDTITFAEISLLVGTYTFNASLSNINGGLDEVSINNNKSINYTIVSGNYTYPITEGFNSSSIPVCWTEEIVRDLGGVAPKLTYVGASTNPTQTPYEGTHMVKFNSDDCERGDQIRLISPAYSSEGKSNITVSFQWSESATYSNQDSLTVQWSTNGISWNYGKTFIRYNNANPGWESKTFTLPVDAENKTSLYIAFLFTADYGINCYFDNFKITVQEPAAATITTGVISGSPFNISSTTGTSINVPFTSTGTYTSNQYKTYLSNASGSFTNEVEIGSLTSDANSGTIQASIPAGTSAGTSYKVRVKSSNPVIIGSESSSFEIRTTTSSITLGSISGSPFVVSKILGKVINIPFTISGGFTANTFTAFLSNKNGEFSTETQIGTLVSNNSGVLMGIIPTNTPSGEAYKARIKSSNPVITSLESAAFSIVLDTIGPTVTVTSNVANPTNVSPIDVSIVFSEQVSGFDISKITVVNATKNQFTLLGNSSFSVKLSPIVDGIVSASVAQGVAFDALGNPNSASQPWNTNYIRALGIEDLLKEGILIFPNPASNVLNIKFEKIRKMVMLNVIGLDGRLYHSIELLNSNNYQLDISNLAKGMYIIRMITEENVINAQLIKQ